MIICNNSCVLHLYCTSKPLHSVSFVIQKTPLITSKVDRNQIITNIQKLLDNKFAASKFMGVKEDLEELIEHQNIADDISMSGACGDSTFG